MLDFTNIKDEPGAAVYGLFENSKQERRLKEQFNELSSACNSQLVLLSTQERNGAEVTDFYDITTFPAILVVRDNDQLAYSWMGQNLPLTSEIAHLVGQIG